jgi:hypothetical protein
MPDEPESRPGGRHYEITLPSVVGTQAAVVADKPPTPAVTVSRSDVDEIHITEDAVVDGVGGNPPEAIRIAREGGGARSATVDRRADGSVSETIAGPPPRKRETEIRTARLLVERWNLDGGAWEPPISCDEERQRTGAPEDGIDCRSHGPDGDVLIQVTSPEVELWAPLHKAGQITRPNCNVEDLIDAIWTAIEKKRFVSGRQGIVLALDATDCPSYSFRSVVTAFQGKFGLRAASVGYQSIWIVGPSASLVQRLDTAQLRLIVNQISADPAA